MKLRSSLAWIIFCTLGWSSVALATGGMSIGYADGTKDVKAYRVGFQKSWANDGVTPNKRRLTGYWELAFTKMHNPITYSFPTINDNDATSLSLVLRIPFRIHVQCFVDIGIGAAYLSDQEISTRNLGSNWLFEDRLGAGILLGERQQYELGYRLVHFSNGYLAQTNQGINFHFLILGYWFR